MVKFDPSIYLKPSDQDDEVIVFGKSPELEISDQEKGISRFGGDWRQPSYTMAYLRSARILIENSKNNNDLDQLGLPIFYLQRHALELFIKSTLDILYEVVEMRTNLAYGNESEVPSISRGQKERLSNSHGLESLNNDLKNTCRILEYEFDSAMLDSLVETILSYETSPSWSRYSKSKFDESHLSSEVAIPLVRIHNDLEAVIEHLGCNFGQGKDTLQNEIHSDWNHLMTITHYEQV